MEKGEVEEMGWGGRVAWGGEEEDWESGEMQVKEEPVALEEVREDWEDWEE